MNHINFPQVFNIVLVQAIVQYPGNSVRFREWGAYCHLVYRCGSKTESHGTSVMGIAQAGDGACNYFCVGVKYSGPESFMDIGRSIFF